MKRKLLLVTLAAAVMLTACGGKEKSDSTAETTTTTEAEATPEAAAEDTGAETGDTEAETGDTEAETGDTEAETGDTAAAGDYVKGTSTETGFESEWLGLRYTAPEGMVMSTEEELNEVMGMGQEMLSEDFSELQLEYAKMSSVYEMMSKNEAGTTNIIVTVEKLPSSNFSVEDYAEAIKTNLKAVTTIAYTISDDLETVSVGGSDFTKITAQADYSGVNMHQDYYVRVIGDRAVSMALTYVDETASEAEAIINAFEAY